jgi:uncharacterized protein YjiS (DUF1127 family)
MTHEILCYAAPGGEPRQHTDGRILRSISTLPGVARLADVSVLRPVLLLCVRCSAYSAACIAEWHRRSRSRRELMALEDRELCDIRLTRCGALYEASKPFWTK